MTEESYKDAWLKLKSKLEDFENDMKERKKNSQSFEARREAAHNAEVYSRVLILMRSIKGDDF